LIVTDVILVVTTGGPSFALVEVSPAGGGVIPFEVIAEFSWSSPLVMWPKIE
jgi:hypothetical protein